MSNGRCNYSEYTQDEFVLLKESGDAEAGDKQGNNQVSILYTLGIYHIASPKSPVCTYHNTNTTAVHHD